MQNLFISKRKFFLFFICSFLFTYLLFFYKIYLYKSIIIPYTIKPYDICITYPKLWIIIKLYSIFIFIFSKIIIFNNVYLKINSENNNNNNYNNNNNNNIEVKNLNTNELNLLVGYNYNNKKKIYLTEKSLFQNILITGTIGSGKTSSAIYPFLEQLISFENNNINKKLGMLILDVKGNMFFQVKEYVKKYNREKDLIVISLFSGEKYNPIYKPNISPIVLANRLKTILTLFSPNSSENYWLDKVEQILTECIKFCRIYNNGYVTFKEIHELISSNKYYKNKIIKIKKLFLKGKLNNIQIYDILSSIKFLENEYFSLDLRTFNILKSEITRITNVFISDYNILNTFSSPKKELSFKNFNEVFNKGKIVVLSMNIFEYKNLAKIIATYLKLDFQTEVMTRLKNNKKNLRTVCFISDEFHEYVTTTDADFFSQSREAKCINIVSTQSYSSILNTIHDESASKVIIQNLVNKLWFRTDDIFTIENAQKQIGKEDKKKISKSISENSNETNYNFISNSFLSKKSNISESISTQIQNDYIFDFNFFTQNLETFSCLSFLSNGNQILPPTKLKMIPFFEKGGFNE